MKRDWDRAFSPTPDIFHERMERTLGAIEEGNEVKKRYKVSVLLVAALAVLALAGGIALAAANGVFAWAAGSSEFETDAARYLLVDEFADTETQTCVSADGNITLEVVQSYYNGNEMYVGYRLTDPMNSGFDAEFKPDAELLEQIKQEKNIVRYDGEYSRDDPEQYEVYTAMRAKEYAEGESDCTAAYHASVDWFDMYITANGQRYEINQASVNSQDDGEVETGYIELFKYDGTEEGVLALPQFDESVQEFDLTVSVSRGCYLYYKDSTGFYGMWHPSEPMKMTFTVKRDDVKMRTGKGHAEFDGYSVDVKALSSNTKMDLCVTMRMTRDKYNEFHSLRPAPEATAIPQDALHEFEMLLGDKVYDAVGGWGHEKDGDYMIYSGYGTLPGIPEDTDSFILRPVYELSGPSPENDITVTFD